MTAEKQVHNPLVSIIVPVYNTENYLPRCINSVLEQSYREWELLLVDDGSTDNSGTICDRYSCADNRIRTIHQTNGGVSKARNTGIDNANGDWICFVDSDDTLPTDALYTMVNGISDNIDMVMGGYVEYDSDGKLSYAIAERICSTISVEQAFMEFFKPHHYRYQGYICSKLFRSPIIKQTGLHFDNDIYFNEDRLFSIRYLCSVTGRVHYTTTPVYEYFLREGSAMASLQHSFNYKYYTDLSAFARMRRCLLANGYGKDFTKAMIPNISYSYHLIADMIKIHSRHKLVDFIRLHYHTVHAAGIKEYIKWWRGRICRLLSTHL
mgnify:CR=1 FL=1